MNRAFLSIPVAVVLAVSAWIIRRADLLWCEARSVPIGTFWRPSGFSTAQMPNLLGKYALVTGANTGLGYEIALQLALANSSVVLACRDTFKCREALDSITQATAGRGKGSISMVQLDLANLSQVAIAADRLIKNMPSIDILVNNAGVATQFPYSKTIDGIETTFQINYLGHFVLTARLMPLLEKNAQTHRARVVHLSSGAHRGAPIEGVPLSVSGINNPAIGAYARYGMAKLANLAFARELAVRYPQIFSNAVHPGVVATEMLRAKNFQAMLGQFLGSTLLRVAKVRNALFAYSASQAALSVLYCAASKEIEELNINGQFFVPIATRWQPRHPQALNPQFSGALWNFSELVVKGINTQEKKLTSL